MGWQTPVVVLVVAVAFVYVVERLTGWRVFPRRRRRRSHRSTKPDVRVSDLTRRR